MNEHPLWAAELQDLLSELLDGNMSEESRQRLSEILRDNPSAQDAYRDFMALHALLHLDFGQGQLQLLPPIVQSPSTFTAEFAAPADGVGAAPEIAERLSSAQASAIARQPKSPTWRAIIAVAAAATLLGIIWSISRVEYSRNLSGRSQKPLAKTNGTPAHAEPKAFPNSDVRAVAVLGQASRASWSDPRLPLDIGSSLPAGTFHLEQGLVQIEFFSGASVIIEGPADFELISPSRFVCSLGKVRAHVPSQAKGFTIKTPNYSAVDLGTEFTVKVWKTGESQFQVLDGEVQLWDGRQAQSVLAQRLLAGQGVRSTAAGELVAIGAEESNFVGRKQMLEMATAAMHERYENWQQFSQEIRSAPNVLLYYGFDGHEPWERALRNEKPNSSEMLDGAIVGCQWTTGRWNAKKALEFKRTSDRVRMNVPGEFESLTVAAWLRIEGLERWLSSLMLTDGHQPGEVHWQMTDMGQLMLGVKAEPERSHDYYSPSVIGPLDLGRWVHLACVYNGKEGYVSHYVDGEEVSRENIRVKTRLHIGAAEIGNWVPQDLQDYRIRSLNGRVDEFILFDTPLSADEIQSIYESGRPQS